MKTLRFVHSRLPLFPRSCQRPAVACRLLPTSHRGQPPVLQSNRSLALSASSLKNWKDLGSSSHTEEEEEDGDLLEETEVEELFQQHVPAGIGQGQHRVFIVHPDVKWGSRKQNLTTAELMMAEAEGLVNTLDNWTVVDKIILSTKTPEKKKIFGKGNFQLLTGKIRGTPGVTAVFVNVDRLSSVSEREFEETWGVKVFDRYSVVLHIFRCNARTKEAKLQISLAEIPLLRSRLKNDMADLDQQGGGARYIGGSGETLYEVQQRLLKERETRIRSALEKLRRKRHLLRSQRKHREFPTVSVLGYTNCGESLETPLGKSRAHRSHSFLLYPCQENHSDQSSDRRQRPAAQEPAVRHPRCDRPRRPAAQSHDRSVRGHHRLPVSAPTPANRLLLRHPGGHHTLGSVGSRQRRQSSRDGESEGERPERLEEPADPTQAAGLHDRGSQ
ncbi:putative GTP-binding protein 6 isoform X3 [Poecilia latipinna]|uniref:putative GTP-binding protein 6 isoform X3 n=1 Tax=Poecilia latipinna TaxID=48699 RepID=UPI00072DCB01|nr:PREDICTED: putative GTP-binding protein 6 isoform X3 [Poecilia latipinna]